MTSRIISFVVLTVVLGSCSQVQSSKDVMAAVLDHFARRSDTSSFDEQGMILIDPVMDAWAGGEFTGLAPQDDQPACQADQTLYAKFVEQNGKERVAAQFLGAPGRWRLADPKELEQMPFLSRTSDDKPLKTVVQLYAPAFSRDGKQAFALLSFTWSIHGAYAGYVVEKVDGRWRVKCSLLNFFV